MSKLAIRRHHEKRIKDKVAKYHLCQWVKDLGEDVQERVIGKMSRTKAMCSCAMCGNPRKWDKELTIAEQSFKETLSYEME